MPIRRTEFNNNSIDVIHWTGATLRSNIKYVYNHIFKTEENITITGILQYFEMLKEAELRGIELDKILGGVIHPSKHNIEDVKYMIGYSDDVGAELDEWLTTWRDLINI